MKLLINSFSGVSPRTPARYLRDDQAQVAKNCPAWVGPLSALQDMVSDDGSYFADEYVLSSETYTDTTSANTLQGVTANSIYLFGAQVSQRQWFHWSTDVDVVKGFVHGDTVERTYFTGDGIPKSTDNTLNAGIAPYPNSSYMLGLPVPSTSLTCVVGGTATTNAIAETRVYTYTWVNSWGEESAPYATDPMPASATVTVKNGETVTITLPVPAAGNYDITKKRIYRSVTGSSGTEYLFVAEVTASTTSYIDSIDHSLLGEALPSLTWQPPPSNLTGLVGFTNGMMAGFVGRDVYISEPYKPFAWPTQYVNTVEWPIVGLGVTDTTLCVLTTGKPVLIQGTAPDGLVVVEPDIHQACMSKRSIVSMMGAVFYSSPDGLMRLSPGGSEIVTKNFMSKDQWNLLSPQTVHAYQHERRYVAFYDSPAYGKGGFVFDIERGVFVFHDRYADCGYSSLDYDTLFLSKNNVIQSWDGGDLLTYVWRSKKFTMPDPVGFSALRLESEGSGVNCSILRDGVQVFSKAIESRKIYRLPPGLGRDWEIELTGSDEVFAVGLAESPAEFGLG